MLIVLSAVLSLFLLKRGKNGDGNAPVSTRPLSKIILIGVDGGDWSIIDPLIAAGRLPNFKKIKDEGATGPLKTIEPILSPLLWTTIATGKLPEEHGILSFTVAEPGSDRKTPITRYHRKVDTIWNFLGDFGRKVDIVGWLATFPAEDINGVMVTDKVGYLAFAVPDEQGDKGKISPAARREEISSLVCKREAVTFSEIKNFIAVGRDEFAKARKAEFDPRDPVNNMIYLYASSQTYKNIGLHLLQKDRPDFLAVYFEIVDAAGHLFMPYAPPMRPEIDKRDYDRYKSAVEQAYIYQDAVIGEFIDNMDDSTILMILSDHGFKSGNTRLKGRADFWAGKAAMWHKLYGILGMYGRGIKKGYKIKDASIMDIAPTILAVEGLPSADDMSGRILSGAFERNLADDFAPGSVPSLDRSHSRIKEGRQELNQATEQTLKKLEALGYITPENPDALNNLGQRYQKNGEFEKAIIEYKKALEINPDFPAVLNNLGVCYGRLKMYADAERAFKSALSINPRDAYAMNNLAVMYMENGRMEKARAAAERAIDFEPNYVNALITLGAVYATMRDIGKAKKSFERVLELDPGNKSALNNLEKLRLISGGN